MIVIFIALFFIIILYFLFAFLPLRVCAICAAVILTWIGLLGAYFAQWHHDSLLLGILMGGSVVGFMYKAEKYFQKKKFTHFWLIRIGIIVFGFLGIYVVLAGQWNKVVFVSVAAVLFGFFTLFFVKPEEKSHTLSAPSSIKEKLDHCCE